MRDPTEDESAESPARPSGPRPARRRAFVLVLIVSLALTVEAVGSLLYRFAVPDQARETVELALGLRAGHQNHVSRYRPHPYFNHVANPDFALPDGTHPHGPLGIRATNVPLFGKRPGTLRIVAMGASTTYGYYLDDAADTWPALLGAALEAEHGIPVDVINVAVPYYTTFEMLGVASTWLPEMEPDIVLLHVGLNDAFAVGYPDEGGPDNTTFRHPWAHEPIPPVVAALMRASRTARLVGMPWLSHGGFLAGDMSAVIQVRRPPEEEVRANVAAATGRYFRRNVRTIVALVRHAGAVPVLVDMPLNPAREFGLGPYYDAVSAAVQRNNGILEDVAKEERLLLVPLHEGMPDAEAFVDVAHVNRAGAQQKAWLIQRALDASGFDPAPFVARVVSP